ncbi:MFS transporter [Alkalihalobacillus trypoxylicola]|nr:MFS transporter [Alkalihalobacillus trypoxylicola]
MEAKKVLPILFSVMFLVMVGFGIIIPVIPFYAEQLGATPTQLGLLMAVYSFMQLIFAPMWGKISDSIGRKPILLVGISGLALSFFMMAFATELWVLFVARIIGGFLSAANMPTVMAYVADITSEENRSKGMGLIGAAVGLGFIFGPAIGGIFSENSLATPFLLAGFSSLVTLVLVATVLKESLPADNKETNTTLHKRSWLQQLKSPLGYLFLLQWFVSLSLAALEATFAYYAYETAGLESKQLGYIFMIMGFAGALVQGGLVGQLCKKWGEGRVIQIGILISALGFGLILFVDSFWTAALFLSIFGIGNGFIRPSISSLLTKRVTSGYGQITGMLSSFDSLGRIIGPPLGGFLFTIFIPLPYISGVFLSLIAFLFYYLYTKQDKKINEVNASISN